MTAGRRGEMGYTLLELLVAMLLLSIIGLLIAGGMQFGSTVWERSAREMTGAERLQMAQTIVRENLTQAVPRQQAGFVEFIGQPDSVDFVGPAPAAMDEGGLIRLELAVVPDGDGARLVLRAKGRDGAQHEAVLAEGAMRIAYLDASEKTPVWLDYWRNRDRLPDAVRIEAEGPSPTWPPLIVHLAIAQDSNCQYDTVSASCRKS